MAFMNRKKPNKMVLWIIVVFISIGLLGTVGGWMFSPGSYNSVTPSVPAGSGSEAKGNSYFTQAFDKLSRENYKDADKLFKDAIAEYEKALKETPDNKAVLGDLATAYFYTGNTDKAIDLVKKALEIDPNFSQARYNYAIYLGDGKKDYLGAIKELQKIKSSDPKYKDAQNLIQSFTQAMTQK